MIALRTWERKPGAKRGHVRVHGRCGDQGGVRVGRTLVRVKNSVLSLETSSPTRDFYRFSFPPTSLNSDRLVQRERHDERDMGEKYFQNFSLFIIWIEIDICISM